MNVSSPSLIFADGRTQRCVRWRDGRYRTGWYGTKTSIAHALFGHTRDLHVRPSQDFKSRSSGGERQTRKVRFKILQLTEVVASRSWVYDQRRWRSNNASLISAEEHSVPCTAA